MGWFQVGRFVATESCLAPNLCFTCRGMRKWSSQLPSQLGPKLLNPLTLNPGAVSLKDALTEGSGFHDINAQRREAVQQPNIL